MKKHSKALVFFAVLKQIPIVYSTDRGRAEISQVYLGGGAGIRAGEGRGQLVLFLDR